jgi:adenylate cyclase class 2
MANTHWEVEQKLRISDQVAVRQKLEELGASWEPPIEQADHYFNHPCRDFAKTDEALRIREFRGERFVTYKGPKIDRETKTRRELELPLPPAAEHDYGELLVALGFRPVATVRKTRLSGSLTFGGWEFEAALDDVVGAGQFLELETTADDQTLAEAKIALAALVQTLGLTEIERRSYLELVLS